MHNLSMWVEQLLHQCPMEIQDIIRNFFRQQAGLEWFNIKIIKIKITIFYPNQAGLPLVLGSCYPGRVLTDNSLFWSGTLRPISRFNGNLPTTNKP